MTEELAEIVAEEELEEVHQLPAVRAHDALVARAALSVDDVVAQKDKIQQVMQRVMKEGVHYGKIPGISKPSLFKPGAEVLCTTFRFAPTYVRTKEWVPREDGQRHLVVDSDCTLTHAPSGVALGSAGGMATTLESKYAYRKAEKLCPDCGMALRKSKRDPEWYCWAKQGGCGAKFPLDHPAIEEQVVGRVDNQDLADTYNTVLKMADKRALVAAILVCTAASELFTQDVEDNAQTAVSESQRSNDAAATGDPLTKMRLDIQDLLRQLDKKRKADAGMTFAEMENVVKDKHGETAWDELDEEATVALGQSLGRYWAYIADAVAKKEPVSQYDVWHVQDDVPF